MKMLFVKTASVMLGMILVSTLILTPLPSAAATTDDSFQPAVSSTAANYTLTAGSAAGGAVTAPGEGTYGYARETVVPLVATPNTGYSFVNWTGNVTTVANTNAASTNITMSDNYTITADFVATGTNYTLTISRTTGGDVTFPGEGTFSYPANSTANFTATPVSGYNFSHWSGDVATVTDVNAAVTGMMMSGNYSITANFALYTNTLSGNWTIGTVDNVGGGSVFQPSVAFDRSGNPHIGYKDSSRSDLKYARWDGTAWQTETVVSVGHVGHWPSLAIDSSGNPHISYLDDRGTIDQLMYAHFDGSVWQIEDLSYSAKYNSLALDSADNPHIFFWDKTNSNYQMIYTRWDGSTWQSENVGGYAGSGSTPSTVIDDADQPHLGLTDGSPYYAHRDGSGWQFNSLTSQTNADGSIQSFALDESGYPHFAFDVGGGGWQWYARWDGSAWQSEVVDVGTYFTQALALDGSGNPHISYWDRANYDIKYAHWDGSTWRIETVASQGDMGREGSMALDASGLPLIVYADQTTHELKYAWWGANTAQRTLTLSSDTSGGSVTTPGEGNFNYEIGTVIDMVATPNSDCFTGWTGGPVAIADNLTANTTVEMDRNHQVRANFVLLPTPEPTPEPTPDSGGGGGGGAPIPQKPEPPAPGSTILTGIVKDNGVFNQNVTANSDDAACCVIITKGGAAFDTRGGALSSISLTPADPEILIPPDTGDIIAAYDGGPTGTIFVPAVTITLEYPTGHTPGPGDTIAWWNGTEWVALPSQVNTESGTISASASHFTCFALIGQGPAKELTVNDLDIVPSEAMVGEVVVILAVVTNPNPYTTSGNVTLKCDNTMLVSIDLTLAGKGSQQLTFTTAKSKAGTYRVAVNDAIGSFTLSKE